MNGVSLILPSYRRSHLLDLTLASIRRQIISFDLEIIVINDGIRDNTEETCLKYKDSLNIKYIFSGQRNTPEEKRRVAGFALNIGVKQSTKDIIILSCAEVYHRNEGIPLLVAPLLNNKKLLTTPRFIEFDDSGGHTDYIHQLIHCSACPYFKDKPIGLGWNDKNMYSTKMPYLMGMWKDEYISIGGYDEDFTWYAADDNDFTDRMLKNGCSYYYVDAVSVHLYHGLTCDAQPHEENPAWVYNQKLYNERKNIIVRNQGREWGKT